MEKDILEMVKSYNENCNDLNEILDALKWVLSSSSQLSFLMLHQTFRTRFMKNEETNLAVTLRFGQGFQLFVFLWIHVRAEEF